MSVPRNVFWFEVLLYAALALDAVSVAFANHSTRSDLLMTSMAAAMILFQFYLVRLAAQRRLGWPRWALAAAMVLAVVSLVEQAVAGRLQPYHLIEFVSCVLAAFGLYLSFTGDAVHWFEQE